jgi:selenocysteine lyase/cysteine desulfurase
MGEWLTNRALGIPESGGRIVTDDLHFFGSFVLYNELKKQGMDVVIVRARDDHKVHLEDLAAAINANTKLVAISAVSTINGFQHDLKAVADLAHAHGAKLYVDAIHGCGVVPIDVKASNIDFLASASYKWLMGDMGLGFLYVRADLIPTLKHPQIGYEAASAFRSHAYPFDPPPAPGAALFDTALRTDAQGLVNMGTKSTTVIAQLYFSLDYIKRLGLERMRAHRQPLLDKARREIPRLPGFSPMTPNDCTSALAAFAYRDARTKLAPLMRDANIRVTLSANRLRVSAAIFNTTADIDRLLNVLASAPRT